MNPDSSTLGGPAVAEFVADVFLCPYEPYRIRYISDPSYADGELATGQKFVAENDAAIGLFFNFGPMLFVQANHIHQDKILCSSEGGKGHPPESWHFSVWNEQWCGIVVVLCVWQGDWCGGPGRVSRHYLILSQIWMISLQFRMCSRFTSVQFEFWKGCRATQQEPETTKISFPSCHSSCYLPGFPPGSRHARGSCERLISPTKTSNASTSSPSSRMTTSSSLPLR